MKRTHTIPALIAVQLILLVLAHPLPAAQPPDLLAAVKTGDATKVKEILRTPGQADRRDARGNTALHWAALASDESLVKRLLASGANARATNSAGATPLHYGVAREGIVKLLLGAGADPHARSVAGVTPLHPVCGRLVVGAQPHLGISTALRQRLPPRQGPVDFRRGHRVGGHRVAERDRARRHA